MVSDNNNDANNIGRVPVKANLFSCDTYPMRQGATKFSFEFQRTLYEITACHDTGNFGILAFLKLVRQYFARRTDEENTVYFENVPVSSLEDRQNINITFDFCTIDNKLCFEYKFCNTDTNQTLASCLCDDISKEIYYQRDINPNECNQCLNEDRVFDAEDFDNDAEYNYFGM